MTVTGGSPACQQPAPTHQQRPGHSCLPGCSSFRDMRRRWPFDHGPRFTNPSAGPHLQSINTLTPPNRPVNATATLSARAVLACFNVEGARQAGMLQAATCHQVSLKGEIDVSLGMGIHPCPYRSIHLRADVVGVRCKPGLAWPAYSAASSATCCLINLHKTMRLVVHLAAAHAWRACLA